MVTGLSSEFVIAVHAAFTGAQNSVVFSPLSFREALAQPKPAT
jgi:hypothetical protein